VEIKPKFKEEDKLKCLRWCDRHCCLCRKNCGVHIELAHIDRTLEDKELNDIDNAIPLCYDCHAKVGHYNVKEPRGNKYQAEELKSRREEIYEEYTRHLVPIIDFQITQNLGNKFPDVSFLMSHIEKTLPVRVSLSVDISKDGGRAVNVGGHYGGDKLWNMNPGHSVKGHFEIQKELLRKAKRISALVNVKIVDEYGRSHKLLPMEWIYELDKVGRGWWYNP